MDIQLFIVILFTFAIHFVGTLSYSVRIAGVRTKQIAMSFSMFNVMVLVARTSNLIQGPILGKRIEENLRTQEFINLEADLRWVIFSASIATLLGIVLLPTFQRVFTGLICKFRKYRSVSMTIKNIVQAKSAAKALNLLTLPSLTNIKAIKNANIPYKLIYLNVLSTAIWTVCVLATLYAGCLEPDLRVTSSQFSSVINGVATIMMFVFIDPYISMQTDDVVKLKKSQASFRRTIVLLAISRFFGTILAQILLFPIAELIVQIAWLL